MEHTLNKNPARDFFLYILVVGTLYVSAWQLIDLVFTYINYLFPDAVQCIECGDWQFADMRRAISILIVVFPVYLGVTWFLRKDIIANPEKREFVIRKWLFYFTLFLAAVTVIADLVTLLNYFLEGELKTRFVLKVLTVLIVGASIFSYYYWDLKREIHPESRPSKWLAALVSVVLLGAVISGFFIMGSPATQRKRRFDTTRAQDLSSIQSQIIEYWRRKSRLPENLADLQDSVSGYRPPNDPDQLRMYEYRVLSPLSFELCAVFDLPAESKGKTRYDSYPPSHYNPYGENWNHGSGKTCFTRTIDPDRYRPQKLTPSFTPD